jgi:hypothetical protein
MIATRSIWPGILMHGLMDWDLGFDPASVVLPQPGILTHSEFWSGLFTPVPYVLSFVFPALALFYVGRQRLPKFVEKYAIKWKLVELEEAR